jgi:signal transduction histidine kinase
MTSLNEVEMRERISDLIGSRGWADVVAVEGPHVRILSDVRRVDRIVGNLVDNALKARAAAGARAPGARGV